MNFNDLYDHELAQRNAEAYRMWLLGYMECSEDFKISFVEGCLDKKVESMIIDCIRDYLVELCDKKLKK